VSAVEASMCEVAWGCLLEQTDAAFRAGDALAARAGHPGPGSARAREKVSELAAEYLEARRQMRQLKAMLLLEGCCW
jgi:hypothetical protein